MDFKAHKNCTWLLLLMVLLSIPFISGCNKNTSTSTENTKVEKTKDNKETSLSEEDVHKKVDENLAIIISSPKESSNPSKYIEAHKKEYDEIVNIGEPAFNYMLDKLNNDTNDGLESFVMAKLCTDILGDKNPVKEEWSSGKEWYKKYIAATKK